MYDTETETFEVLADKFGATQAYQRLVNLGADQERLDIVYDEYQNREIDAQAEIARGTEPTDDAREAQAAYDDFWRV